MTPTDVFVFVFDFVFVFHDDEDEAVSVFVIVSVFNFVFHDDEDEGYKWSRMKGDTHWWRCLQEREGNQLEVIHSVVHI